MEILFVNIEMDLLLQKKNHLVQECANRIGVPTLC